MKKRLLAIFSLVACMSIGFASPLNGMSAMAMEDDAEVTSEAGDTSEDADVDEDAEKSDSSESDADQEQQMFEFYGNFIDEFADEWFTGEIKNVDHYLLKNEIMTNGVVFEYNEKEDAYNKLVNEAGEFVKAGELTGKMHDDNMGATVSKKIQCKNKNLIFTFEYSASASEAKVTFKVSDEKAAAADSDEKETSADSAEKVESGDFAKAGLNTILGMGTVFIVLIFISFIISLFVLFSKAGKKNAAQEEVKAAAPAPVPEVYADDNDDEIAAVIAAAIAAYEADENVYDVPADGLYVRSIKKRGFC